MRAHLVLEILLNMAMIGNMVLTVAVVTLTAGAIAEFQFRIGNIGSAADGATVGIGGFGGSSGSFIRARVKANDFRFSLCGFDRLLLEQAAKIDPPGKGNHIEYIFAKEQEIIGKGNDGKQIAGEGQGEQVDQYNDQIDQSKDPGFDGNDEEQQESGIGVQRCIAQEKAEVQIGHAGIPTENHAVNIHHDDTGKIKQVEPQGSPDIFHSPAKGIVTEQGNCSQQQIAGVIGQRIGDQTPDLAPEDQIAVKIQQGIQVIVTGHFRNQIDDGGADDDIQHQIGNTLVPVLIAIEVKTSAKVFQWISSPMLICFLF